MNLEEAMELVLNEAEISALGDEYFHPNSQKVMVAIDVLQGFYEKYGYQFAEYKNEHEEDISS